MESRRKTTVGVPFWTPAPVRTSPTSTEASEDIWEEEEEEEEEEAQTEGEDDFESQMDENGIIGLSEALETVEVGEARVDVNVDSFPGSLTPRENVQLTPLQDKSYNHTESPTEDLPKLSRCNNVKAGFRSWTEDEDVRQRIKPEQLEEEEIQTSDADKHQQFCTSGDLGSPESHGRISLTRSCSVFQPHVEPAGVSKHKLSQSEPALSHLLHFSAEELASAPGIDAETLPEISLLESLPDSQSSRKSTRSCRLHPKLTPRASPQPAEMFERVDLNQDSESPGRRPENSMKHYKPSVLTASPRNMRSCSYEDSCMKPFPSSTAGTESVKTRTPTGRSPNEVDQSRKGTLSHHTPDLSKVEAKVNFPKGGYKPPKSRLSKKKKGSLAPEAPLVFKSPADIVKEVLLNTTDEPPSPSGSIAVSTMPQDFRSRQQATSLLQQLQDDYNRLLTKYAAAENTIDRLRLEAKVNLYSDPPNAGHCVQSGVNHNALKFNQLDFPQANRAEIDSAAPNGHGTHQGASSSSTTTNPPRLPQQLATILFSQADKFLQQLQTFENLLRSGKLKPLEQVVSLSHLAEGLDSLERGYLLTRDQHKLLQQQQQPGAATSQFDPERELEGLIFQCGLHLDEIKEQVEQKLQQESVCDASPPPPPPPLQPAPSSSPSEWRETPTHPQSPLIPSLDDPGEAAEEEVRYEQSLSSFYLKSQKEEHGCAELDFLTPFDPNRSFKELPKLLVHSLRERVPTSAPLQRDFQPADEEDDKARRGQGTKEVQKTLPQREVKSDHDSSPVQTSKPHRGSPADSTAHSQPPTPAQPGLHPRSRRRLEEGRAHSSSLSSLGDVAASERMRSSSKTEAGSRRVLSQDGIVSPETDSGFIGSESSRLTLAAAQSPVQQRAPDSVSVSPLGNSSRPHAASIFTSTPSQPRGGTAPEPTAAPRFQQPARSMQGPRRRTYISPQRWTQQTGVNIHTESEGEQSERYTQSVDSLHTSHLSSSSSSSPAARRHHGDTPTALSSTHVPNCNDAIRTLQVEVTRLRERLESGLRSQKTSDPPAELSSSRRSTMTPRIRSAEKQSCVREGRRETLMLDEVDESDLRPAAKKKTAHRHRVLTRSDLKSTSVHSQTPQTPHVSRFTQTPTEPDARCSHATVSSSSSRMTQHRQPCAMSAHTSEATDDSDSRSDRGPPRSHRLPHHRRFEYGGDREAGHSSAHCPFCEGLELQRRPEPDCCRHSRSAGRQPGESPEKAARSGRVAATAPPALLHWQPACPHQLLLYSSPLYMPPPDSSTDTPSGVRGRVEVRGRTRRSLSADRGSSVDDSLNRAIRAARRMKHTSRHMACCLSAGLQHQELLAQSCSY